MRSGLVLLSLFACVSSAAQDRLTVSVETVFFPDDSSIYASNKTESPLSLDSLSVQFSGPRAWLVEIVANDTSFLLHDLSPAYDSTASVDFIVEPAQTVEIRLAGFDPCIVCKGGTWNPNRDTLFVYSGGSDQPSKVVLDVSSWVAVEELNALPDGAPRLKVFPRPADRVVTIEVSEGVAEEGRLFDLLGREVARLDQAWSSSLTVDVNSLPPGVYLLRLALRESQVLVSTVVVTH